MTDAHNAASLRGYCRQPAIFRENIVFISDDDMWTVTTAGGSPRRLTTGLSEISDPMISPDGAWIAFSAGEEGGREVYGMPFEGGPIKRLTFHGDQASVTGWDKEKILFSSAHTHPFGVRSIFSVDCSGHNVALLPYGPCNSTSIDAQHIALQRHGYGYVNWKRYKGGTAGELWTSTSGSNFQKLDLGAGNYLKPALYNNRLYFLSDRQGHGNVYSCTIAGHDIKRHTHHQDYYVRSFSIDSDVMIYAAGGKLHHVDLKTDQCTPIDINLKAQHTQSQRKFVSAARYLQDFSLNPDGSDFSVVTRGKVFAMMPWSGPAIAYGAPISRYRTTAWLDGTQMVGVASSRFGDKLEIFTKDAPQTAKSIVPKQDFGWIMELTVCNATKGLLIENHRCELWYVDASHKKAVQIAKSPAGHFDGAAFSPDGLWIVYSMAVTSAVKQLKLYNVKTTKTVDLTRPQFRDTSPSFDPEGKYLYFISQRIFTPVLDQVKFDYSFPKGHRPYVIALSKETRSPFIIEPKKPVEVEEKKDTKKKVVPTPTVIDVEGITDRIVAFPVSENLYTGIVGLKGKVLLISAPLACDDDDTDGESQSGGGMVDVYDFATLKREPLLTNVKRYTVSTDGMWFLYQTERRLRLVRAGEKPDDTDTSFKKGGWMDLGRITVSIEPNTEWCQIFDEAWLLQKEMFWTADMGNVDWMQVYDRYRPLVDRITTRGELSDIIAEMHGELGTSHAYISGGDMRPSPSYDVGLLGADVHYDATKKGYKIDTIYQGSSWDEGETSPLAQMGVGLKAGDLLTKINHTPLGLDCYPGQLLLDQANMDVAISFIRKGSKKEETLVIKAMASERPARYRQWVNDNRDYVHDKTNGAVGYVHIPDMSRKGFAEFFRAYDVENTRQGLIIDVRYNGGGNISPLILEKLSKRRLGYDFSRWFGAMAYPADAPCGPLVAIANEYAGSDGDMFSHAFKMMDLGPLIGKRTWGGVIGIWPRFPLVDGTVTTQPEMSFWFTDTGWHVENHGVDPTIEVEITPEDHHHKKDPQLDRAIAEALLLVKERPTVIPMNLERPFMAPSVLKGLSSE